MSKRYSGKSFKDSSIMKKPKYCVQSVLVDIAKKNCENCARGESEKVFSDLGYGYRNCFNDS